MAFFGGMNANTIILASIEWQWIICQSQVHCFIFSADLSSRIYLIATSVDVEQTFSQGRLVLSHVRSQLSVQSTRALLCLGVWSLMGYVRDDDVQSAALLPEVNGEEEGLADNWDSTL